MTHLLCLVIGFTLGAWLRGRCERRESYEDDDPWYGE
jgi:hypothetical protein